MLRTITLYLNASGIDLVSLDAAFEAQILTFVGDNTPLSIVEGDNSSARYVETNEGWKFQADRSYELTLSAPE